MSRLRRFVLGLFCIGVSLGWGGLARGQCDLSQLVASDSSAEDQFGSAVSISGDVLVVGAPFDDDVGEDSGSAYVYRFDGTSWVEDTKLIASDGFAFDQFGGAVSISGPIVVVGAPFDDVAGSNSGSAYIFRFDGTGWVEESKLTASDAAAGDRFGTSVSMSGGLVVVGAKSDDVGPLIDSGSAYIYRHDGANWIEETKLTASDAETQDEFGSAVSISGNRVAVGAALDDDSGEASGSAYVYYYQGTSWVEEAKLTASDAALGDSFGGAVSISGHRVVVGAMGYDAGALSDSGSVYTYRFDGTSWGDEAKLEPSFASADERFGRSVTISGNLVVVGAANEDAADSVFGSVFIYRHDGSSWSEDEELFDGGSSSLFGRSVSISGERVVVGGPLHDGAGPSSGIAYVLREGAFWAAEAKIEASDPAMDDQFGNAVSIDGDVLAVGVRLDDDAGLNSGSAYIYRLIEGSWVQEAKIVASDAAAGDLFGGDISISGDIVVVSARNNDDAGTSSGSAYVYRFDGINWIEEAKLTASDATTFWGFGNSVSISGDVVVVSANGADGGLGAVYVFRYDGVGWVEEAKLVASDPQVEDEFGELVSIDGNRILVGADHGDAFAGSAYIFGYDGTTWTEQIKLTAPSGGFFGTSGGVSGDRVLVGTLAEEEVYVYRYTGTDWVAEATLTASDGGTDFGSITASIWGGLVVVGAFTDDEAGSNAGAAYVYRFDGTNWVEVAKITTSDAAAGDQFGTSSSLSGNRVAVGAISADGAFSNTGAVYIFEPATLPSLDCNLNGVSDLCDIEYGLSLDCNLNDVPDECEPGVSVSSDPTGTPVTVVGTADECLETDGTTPFVRLHPPGVSLALTAPVTLQVPPSVPLLVFVRWIRDGVDQQFGQPTVDVITAVAPIQLHASYTTPYDYVLDGFDEVDPMGERLVSHEELVQRYTAELPAGGPSIQSYFESLDLTDDPVHLQQYVQLQTLLGNAFLVSLDELGYLDVDEDGFPDLGLEEFLAEIFDHTADGLVEMRKVLTHLREAEDLIALDASLGTSIEEGAIRDLVYAIEIMSRLSLRRIQAFAWLAAEETPEEQQEAGSSFLAAQAEVGTLIRTLNLTEAVIGSVLTPDEQELTRLLSLNLFAQQANQIMAELQRRIVPSGWTTSLGLAPQSIQVWQNYVPNPSISMESLWQDAVTSAHNARDQWLLAQSLARQFDMDQTALTQALADLRSRYLVELEELTGIDPTCDGTGGCDPVEEDFLGGDPAVPLGDREAIGRYYSKVFGSIDRPPLGNFPGPEDLVGSDTPSELAEHLQHLLIADAAVERARAEIRRIEGYIETEQDRSTAVIEIILADVDTRVSLEELITDISSTSQSRGSSQSYVESCSGGFLGIGQSCEFEPGDAGEGFSESSGTSFNPRVGELIDARGDLVFLTEMQRVAIEGAQSESSVRRLLFDLAVAFSERKQRELEYEAAILAFRRVTLRLALLIDEYVAARADLSSAYFVNPAYRVLRDEAKEYARWLTVRAKILAYRAARRLEYAWSWRYSNEDLGSLYDGFDSVSSIFRASTAEDVLNFLRALKEWDFQSRQMLANQELDHAVISVRKDVLGLPDFEDGDLVPLEELLSRRATFQQFVQGNLLTQFISVDISGSADVPSLLLPFAISTLRPISTPRDPTPAIPPVASRFDPDEWNRKIQTLRMNLVGDADLLTGSPEQAVSVTVVQRGAAALEPNPLRDETLILFDPDPWEDLSNPFAYPNAVSFEATVNQDIFAAAGGTSFVGTGFENRAVSASEWTIYISTNLGPSVALDFSQLRDIELRIEYEAKSPDLFTLVEP